VKAMPKLNQLAADHADQGLVLIGIHSTERSDTMEEFVKEHGIKYPVAVDDGRTTTTRFGVDSFPDYYLIDRHGKVRFADLANHEIERAVKMLLAEPPPLAEVLHEAGSKAQRRDQRILAVWGNATQQKKAASGLRGDRDFSTFLRYEYQVVRLAPEEQAELATQHGVGRSAVLVAMTADGRVLGRLDARVSDNAAVKAFLESHQVPVKDAEELWIAALAQAERENKRILVHLGAPW
jgi:hypothetical protein